MSAAHLDILRKYWGYASFRGIQKDIIDSISSGRDTLGLMPTGGGKSVTFQVPALATEGLCLVVTPLIALMKDQVANLRAKGIKAAAIYSGMSRDEIIVTLENCVFGGYKFLYISPERLSTEIFRTKLRSIRISMIAVDEAHCISQWGYDFRPSYLKIAEVRKLLPGVPVLALTATATPEVVTDIQEKLLFRKENVFRMSFSRPNLAYVVRKTDDKSREMVSILNKVSGSAIVYARSRKKTKELCELLREEGFTAEFYHAGLNSEEKDDRQRKWRNDETRIMVATNAFGMGIDKPDVRVVIHADVPDSLEAYFQEAGRAGRDGRKAFAVLLYGEVDKRNLRKHVAEAYPDADYIRNVYESLNFYYQVGVDSGCGAIFEFDLFEFCQRFKLSATLADSALKILSQAGYIEYTDVQDNPSRIRFLLSRREIDSISTLGTTARRILETLMRAYTGLFTDYAQIDESLVAYRCEVRQDEVYQTLLELGRRGILKYIPRKKTPYIIYAANRVDTDLVRLPDAVYADRRKQFVRRVEAVIDYCTDTSTCRSRKLLAYFGEKGADNCMVCDVCLRHTAAGMRFGELDDIVRRITAYLTAHPHALPADVVSEVEGNREHILDALQYMSDKELVKVEDGGLRLSTEE